MCRAGIRNEEIKRSEKKERKSQTQNSKTMASIFTYVYDENNFEQKREIYDLLVSQSVSQSVSLFIYIVKHLSTTRKEPDK